MELWIRSQDRERLTIANEITYKQSGSVMYNGVYCEICNGKTLLGTYETKQRALEVLDEIQNLINPKIVIKQGKPLVKTLDGTVYREPDEVEIKELNVVFYQMPKE